MTSTVVEPPRPREQRAARTRRAVRLHHLVTWGVFVGVVGVGGVVIKSHPVKYVSSGAIVFVGSETITEREARSDEKVDPSTQSVLARFGNPTVVADIFARKYESWAKQTELARAGLRGTLLVTTATNVSSDTPDHGPVIVFAVSGDDPTDTAKGVVMTIADLQKELAKWQKGADPSLSVSISTVTPPSPGLPASGSRSRAAVGVVAFAALFAWLVGLADRERRSRRTRRTASESIDSSH